MLTYLSAAVFVLASGADISAPDSVVAELRKAAGAGASACGVVSVRQSRRKAAACVRKAQASGRSFWVAFQRWGTDSVVWEGAAGNTDASWALFYDSDASGGSGELKPILNLRECPGLTLVARRQPVVHCANDEADDP